MGVQSLSPTLTSRSRAHAFVLPALMLACATYQLGASIINPLFPQIAQSFHVSLGLVGEALTVQAAAGAATAFGAMFVADRIPRRRQLLCGLSVQALATVGLATVPSFGVWTLLQALSGGATGLVMLACTVAVADYFGPAQRGNAMAWVMAAAAMAWLVGLPLIGWLATSWNWRVSYLWAGGGAASLAFFVTATGLPAPRNEATSEPQRAAGWRELLAGAGPRGWLAGELLAATAWSAFLIYVGPFFAVTYRLNPQQTGFALSGLSFIGILGMRASAPWSTRWTGRRVLLASTMLAALAIAVPFALRLSPLLSFAAFAPYAFLGCVRVPTSATTALSLLPSARGTMMAGRLLATAIAAMLGAFAGGLLLTTAGFGAIGICCAVVTSAGFVLYWRSTR